MSEEVENNEEKDDEFASQEEGQEELEKVIHISGMYKEWFLDYASYVILERAVPHISDGLKPVQRRILHSMKEMDDGRYHKVANIIGNTMKFHPHGDASIGDALVQIGQRDLLIDCQGNWGNILTGDRAAAPRYIEARLTKFALEVMFNAKTTNWQASYDGRNREPITLPVKFPFLLTSGVEGIAVGLACKLLPHNFIELIDGSIANLKGKKPKIYPDFPTGGTADFSEYNDGLRGGRIKVRARISVEDKKTLKVTEIPFTTTTSSLIDSILKANDKGKIKVKRVEDNTAENVEILIHLANNVSPDKTIDALYAFSDCELSISPNSCVIENDKPRFMGVSDILSESTEQTKGILQLELEIRKRELEEQWHFASLEKIFIEKRIYRDIEECETWVAIIETIHKGLKPHVKHLLRAVTDEDVARLTEIKIKRISKFDSFKADDHLAKLEEEIEEVKHHLANLTDYAIDYFKNLKKKYAKGKERKTEIRQMETISRALVAANNVKLYVDREEGFIGHGLKRTESEFVKEASDIDDIIVIRDDGKMIVTRMADKTFVGKGIRYINTWKKGDPRTIYNLIYQDGAGGNVMVKRFNVTSITRDREYELTKGTAKSKIIHLTANPNGEAEVVTIIHRQKAKLKRLKFEFDFKDVAIKGRGAKGNILTKHSVNRIELKEKGVSTLAARKVWFDEAVKRLNYEERGRYLGAFAAGDRILCLLEDGAYRMTGIDVTTKFDENMIHLEKWIKDKPISAAYYEPDKDCYYIKRFLAEESDKPVLFISEHEKAKLEYISTDWSPMLKVHYDQRSGTKPDDKVDVEEFITVKGLKAQGNILSKMKVKSFNALDAKPHERDQEVEIEPVPEPDPEPEPEVKSEAEPKTKEDPSNNLKVVASNPENSPKKPLVLKKKAEEEKEPKPDKKESKPKAESIASATKAAKKPSPKKEVKTSEKAEVASESDEVDDQDSFDAGSQITLEL
ncbi:MAG: DNA gyrase/topoisomerase IV subunit A [Flavobacteriales bacterium]|nr:DNA gyrase/topoisomerase IV subunit A [Flavobacteriales bacterium]